MSNAAEKARRTSAEASPQLEALRMSIVIQSRADSVLCCGRYADLNTGSRLLAERWSLIYSSTIRSSSLDKKDRLKTGRKFLSS